MQCIRKANNVCSSNQCWQSNGKQYTQWIDKNRRKKGNRTRFLTCSEKKNEKWKNIICSYLIVKHRNDCLHSNCAHACHVLNPEPISIEMYTHMCCVRIGEYLCCALFILFQNEKKIYGIVRAKQSRTKTWKKTKEDKGQQKFATVATSAGSINISIGTATLTAASTNQPSDKNHFSITIDTRSPRICTDRWLSNIRKILSFISFTHSFALPRIKIYIYKYSHSHVALLIPYSATTITAHKARVRTLHKTTFQF